MAQIPATTYTVPPSESADLTRVQADMAIRTDNAPQRTSATKSSAPPRECETLRQLKGWYQLYGNVTRGGSAIFLPPSGTLDPVLRTPIGTYLSKHERETDEEFSERLSESFTLGYCREILTIFSSTLFRQDVDRSPALEIFGREHLGNIDGQGHSAREFLRRALDLAQIYGWVGCVTDLPRESAYPSRYAEEEADPRPFSRLFTPTRLWDWKIDDLTGDFVYAEIWNGEPKQDARWKRWYPDRWEVVLSDGTVEDSGSHTIGRVPIDILICQAVETDDGMAPFGRSALSEAAKLELHLYQMCSLLEAHQRLALFVFLHIEADPAVIKQSGKASAPDLDLGSTHYFWNAGAVSWVEPPKSLPEEARAHISWAVQEMRRAAGVATRSEESTEAHSGAALTWEYSSRHNAVAERAQNLEDFESRLWRTHAEIMGIEIPADIVRYPREYAVQPISQELAELKSITELAEKWDGAKSALLPLVKRKLRRIAIRDVGHLPEIDGILDSIDAMGELAEEPLPPPPPLPPLPPDMDSDLDADEPDQDDEVEDGR